VATAIDIKSAYDAKCGAVCLAAAGRPAYSYDDEALAPVALGFCYIRGGMQVRQTKKVSPYELTFL